MYFCVILCMEVICVPMSEAKKRANKKWNDANVKDLYDRINFVVKKGQRDIIKEHAASMGETMSEFIVRAIQTTMENDK